MPMNSENSEPKGTFPKKSNKAISILKFIGKGLLTILFILSIIFQFPWKVIAFLAIVLAACTILPKKFRKRFWLTVSGVVLTLIIWILVPENNTGWRPYTFDKEISDLEAKYKIPDEENATLKYYEIFENINLDANKPDYFVTTENSSIHELWLAQDHPELADWIAEKQGIIENTISASKLPKCIIPPDFYKDRFNFFNDLAKIRHCVNLLISSANNDIAESRFDQAMEKYLTCFRIANQLHQFPSFGHVMAGWALKGKTIPPLNKAIIGEKIGSEYLPQILNLFDDMQVNWSSDWIDMLNLNILSTKNYFVGKTFETNGNARLRFSRRSFWEDTESLQEQVYYTYLSGITGKLRAISRWICFPPSIKVITQIIKDCTSEHYEMAKPDYDWNKENFITHIELNYEFVMKVMFQETTDTYKQIHDIYLKDNTLLRGSKILIALRQYKDEHGTWPESLDEIKSNAPAEAFIDPATEKQLQYEKSGEDFTLSGELINIWPYDSFN
ncbi:MAG: hypothetical protein JXA96_08140 [Sedimentisphaerales bacterium]|nr:hypothetical protein [Sedimentisphaerales bacterium]